MKLVCMEQIREKEIYSERKFVQVCGFFGVQVVLVDVRWEKNICKYDNEYFQNLK